MVSLPQPKTIEPPRNAERARLDALQGLLAKVTPIPDSWLTGPLWASKSHTHTGGSATPMECITCESYKTLINAWRKALKWTDGLDHALTMMLAVVTSTKAMGDQLWIKVLGVASSGKSTLCEALSVAREYVYPKDTLTGLTSGYQSDESGRENISLVEKIRNKTLVINDGDSLLKLPNLPQILSQLRAFYGRNLRTSYKNKMSTDHEGISTSLILCGTSSLREIDASELGERFLTCVLMEEIDEELEDEIGWRAANKALRNMSLEVDGKPETQQEPELTYAMQLTGGYVTYLRENSSELLTQVNMSEACLKRCAKLGKFIALLRARPSIHQDESEDREFSARLISQLVRTATCLAVVLNRKQVDEKVMKRVKRIALDTSRGQTLVMTSHLYDSGKSGCEVKSLTIASGKNDSQMRKLLKFLRQIGVTENFRVKKTKGRNAGSRWRLTERMRKLYSDVVIEENE